MQGRLPIIAALVAGLVAIVLLNVYVEDVRRSLEPATTRVLVAATDLRPGTIVEGKDIAMAVRPTEALPALAVKWEERSLYLGQSLEFPVQPGDYILASYFGAPGTAAQRLSEKVDAASNERALTIPVSAETSLERSLRPDDRIDLLLTYSIADTGGATAPPARPASTAPRLVTTPLLENVSVLATGKFGQVTRGDYSTITVRVSPDEAKVLIWAMNLGKLSVLLRNPKDLQATDRSYLSGGPADLTGLAGPQMRVEDVISANRATAAPAEGD